MSFEAILASSVPGLHRQTCIVQTQWVHIATYRVKAIVNTMNCDGYSGGHNNQTLCHSTTLEVLVLLTWLVPMTMAATKGIPEGFIQGTLPGYNSGSPSSTYWKPCTSFPTDFASQPGACIVVTPSKIGHRILLAWGRGYRILLNWVDSACMVIVLALIV